MTFASVPWPWLVLAFLGGSLFGFAGFLGLVAWIGSLGEEKP